MEYLLILIADVLIGVTFLLNKKYQQYAGASLVSGLRSNYIIGFCQTLLFFIVCGFRPQFSLYSLVLASLVGILGAVYTMIGLNILKGGKVAIYAMFLLSGGMMLPFLYGVIFGNEKITPLRIVGLLAILFAIVITNLDKNKPTKKQILLSIAVFFTNGLLVVISNMHQKTVGDFVVPSTSFIMMANGVKCLLAFVISRFLLLGGRGRKEEQVEAEKTAPVSRFAKLIPLLLLVATAIVDGASFFCQVEGAAAIPATVLYPLCAGGAIVMTALLGLFVLKEKPTKGMIAGMVVCLVGMCLFI